jgi:uncharacterized RmlC-like cupin family protein
MTNAPLCGGASLVGSVESSSLVSSGEPRRNRVPDATARTGAEIHDKHESAVHDMAGRRHRWGVGIQDAGTANVARG